MKTARTYCTRQRQKSAGLGKELKHASSSNELSHEGTQRATKKHSKAKPNRLPGIGNGYLFRHPKVHHSKIFGPSYLAKTQCRTGTVTASEMCPPTARNTRKEIKSHCRNAVLAQNSTGGNRGNRETSPSSFPPLPSVQPPSVARRNER